MQTVLQGVRILAVEQYGAGPFGTQYLSDLGAEVIKIEDPRSGGDVSRTVGPYFGESLPETADSFFFQGLNRNKKSLALDITHPKGRAIFEKLVVRADAVANNLRGDVPKKLGVGYAQLAPLNKAIVCAHLSGYGREGSRSKWPGYDYLMQAEAGYFHLTGEPDSAPSRMGHSMIDLMTGAVMGLGLVSAILSARQTGIGRDVDVSLFDVALSSLNYLAHWNLNAGANPTRLPRSAHQSLTPCQTYRTNDGWIYLMCNKEKFWGLLCQRLGRPEWIDDPRFRHFPDRLAHRDLLTSLLDDALSSRTTDEWMRIFEGVVPAAPILDVASAIENPYVADSWRIGAIPVAGGPDLKLMASPIRSGQDELPDRRAPALGEHNSEILNEIGLSAADIDELKAEGVL